MKKRSSDAAGSIEVGYGKPPKANQFRKGQTGNPRGKRQGEENIISAFIPRMLRVAMATSPSRASLARAFCSLNANYSAACGLLSLRRRFLLAQAATSSIVALVSGRNGKIG